MRGMIDKNKSGVYYSKRKSVSDEYAIKRYDHQLVNENMNGPNLLQTINKDTLIKRNFIPSELSNLTSGSTKVARIAAPPYAVLRELVRTSRGWTSCW